MLSITSDAQCHIEEKRTQMLQFLDFQKLQALSTQFLKIGSAEINENTNLFIMPQLYKLVYMGVKLADESKRQNQNYSCRNEIH
jgi:hypothetical protein